MSVPKLTHLNVAIRQSNQNQYNKYIAAGLLTTALTISLIPSAYAQQSSSSQLTQSQYFDIPAQALSRSITDLAEHTGLHIILTPGQLDGLQGQAVKGNMSTKQALDTLLKHTNVVYQIDSDNLLSLEVIKANNAQSVELDQLSITGDWLSNVDQGTVHTFPGARNRLTQEEIEKSGASSLSEAFRKIPGVQVRVPAESYGGNHALSIGVRGLQSRFSEKSTILLDGMPLSFAPYGQPHLSIAPTALGNLASIDVVKGGSSVRYGPQNVGGIINFVTPKITEETTSRLRLKSETAIDAGEQNFLGQVSASASGKLNEDTGLAVFYSGSHGEGYRENSDEDIDDLLVKGEVWLSDTESLDGHLRYYKGKTKIPGGLNPQEYASDPWQSRYDYNHFKGDRTEGRIRYINDLSDAQQFEIQAYAANTFRGYGLQFNPDSRQRYDEWDREYNVFGIEPRFSQLLYIGDTDHEVSVGYRFIKEEADIERYRWNNFAAGAAPRSVTGVLRSVDSAGTTAHAAFIDDKISMGDWRITPGVRFEDVTVFRHSKVRKNNENDFRNERHYNEVLPSLSVAYLMSPATTLFSNYSTSFGTLQHLQLSDTERNTLKPEIAKTIEVGGRYNKDNLSAEMTLFNINFDNQLQYDDGLEYHVNKGETQHYGVELGASYAFPNTGVSVYGNLAYTQAEFRDGDLKGKELPYYSNVVTNLGMEYQTGRWTWNLDNYSQTSQYADNENTDDLTVNSNTYYTGKLPSFSLWNTRISYQFNPSNQDNIIAFGVKNLFNEDYYSLSGPDQPYGAGISKGAPTTAYVELDMKF
ncbi:TonB-dependent siderophore receptor [Marinomonas fungiae]|uniref:TonB-dependent siderophore receptor n=1 Tax=Marinomonas fungiae TaxID=1137284 RepID=A0A0K6II12_9GAMM|nr:TonB-dependent receptor [Marinomonas fungiae]CUB02982.1 TonB-dependent siderophore receptor [Marinomonas fungiae]